MIISILSKTEMLNTVYQCFKLRFCNVDCMHVNCCHYSACIAHSEINAHAIARGIFGCLTAVVVDIIHYMLSFSSIQEKQD